MASTPPWESVPQTPLTGSCDPSSVSLATDIALVSDEIFPEKPSLAVLAVEACNNEFSPQLKKDVVRKEKPISSGSKWLKKFFSFKGLISGAGLITNGYNAMIIGYLVPVFRELYPETFTHTIERNMSIAYLLGEIMGMIFFGCFIDRIGRKGGIICTTLFLITGIAIVTIAGAMQLKNDYMTFCIIIAGRAISGFGAGGEFPVTASGATEASNQDESARKHRGFQVALKTDFCLDIGFVGTGAIVLIVYTAFREHVNTSFWSTCFAIGLALPIVLAYSRVKLLDNTQYERHAIKHKVPYILPLKMYWKPLVGMSLCWFCYGAMYVFGLFGASIIKDLKPGLKLKQTVIYTMATQAAYLPGSLLGGFCMDKFGRKRTLVCGFIGWAAVTTIIASSLPQLAHNFPAFIFMSCLFNMMSELGPGPAMFVCATESFPTAIRGQYTGFAAAMGRAGSALYADISRNIVKSSSSTIKGEQIVFAVAIMYPVIGALSAGLLVPDKEKDLESEDLKFDDLLQRSGFVTNVGTGNYNPPTPTSQYSPGAVGKDHV